MHKELIGQEAFLSLPCSIDATALLLGFVEELMEVSGDEAEDPERLEQEMRAALDAICSHPAVDDSCSVVARFDIRDDGVDVRLTCENHGADIAEQVVAARAV